MDFRNIRESKNWADETKPSLASRLLTDAMITMQRIYDPKGQQATLDNVQRQRDAAPLPEYNQKDNENTTVQRSASGKGTTIKRPGAGFDEYVSDQDPGITAAINHLIKNLSHR